jgi:UDP-N-acetylglucosamine 4-epimerase
MDNILNKRFLITGGAGFIGSHIATYLLKNGAKFVRVLDNLSNGLITNIEHLRKYPNFQFVKGTITDYDVCVRACTDIDIICHQAGLASVPKSINEPSIYHETNVTGFLNILNAAKFCNIKRVVHASSSSVYGDVSDAQKKENSIGQQLCPYALNKYINELYGQMYTNIYSLECIALRYFNVFGPRQRADSYYSAVIPKFTTMLLEDKRPTIYGTGLQSRDFTFVDNVVLANIKAMTTTNKECFGKVFNIGTGSSMSVVDLYNKISDNLGINIAPIFADKREGDVENSLADISLAQSLLRWQPTISLGDGLQITISSFKGK